MRYYFRFPRQISQRFQVQMWMKQSIYVLLALHLLLAVSGCWLFHEIQQQNKNTLADAEQQNSIVLLQNKRDQLKTELKEYGEATTPTGSSLIQAYFLQYSMLPEHGLYLTSMQLEADQTLTIQGVSTCLDDIPYLLAESQPSTWTHEQSNIRKKIGNGFDFLMKYRVNEGGSN